MFFQKNRPLSKQGQTGKFHYRELHTPQSPAHSPLLLIGLHGHGSNEEQMGTLVNLEPKRPYIYLSLQAFLPLDGGYTWLPITIEQGDVQIDEIMFQHTLARIADFTRTMQQHYRVTADHTVIIGYSLGASMSLALSLAYPHLIGGAAVLTGILLPEAQQLARTQQLANKPLFIGYGTQDPLITPADMQTMQTFLREKEMDVTYREYRIPHVVSGAERQDVTRWLEQLPRSEPTQN